HRLPDAAESRPGAVAWAVEGAKRGGLDAGYPREFRDAFANLRVRLRSPAGAACREGQAQPVCHGRVPQARPAPTEPAVKVHSATPRDIAAREAAYAESTAKDRRRRELVRRSDDLLERLESLNLAKFEALKTWSALDDCRLTTSLAKAVNQLLLDVGLESS